MRCAIDCKGAAPVELAYIEGFGELNEVIFCCAIHISHNRKPQRGPVTLPGRSFATCRKDIQLHRALAGSLSLLSAVGRYTTDNLPRHRHAAGRPPRSNAGCACFDVDPLEDVERVCE